MMLVEKEIICSTCSELENSICFIHLQSPIVCLNIWDLFRYSSRSAILKCLWLAVMLLRLLAENTFWCQTEAKGSRFAANMTADMQQNVMVDLHRPCLEPLGLQICGPGAYNTTYTDFRYIRTESI